MREKMDEHYDAFNLNLKEARECYTQAFKKHSNGDTAVDSAKLKEMGDKLSVAFIELTKLPPMLKDLENAIVAPLI